jgi:hypothetical protein
LTVVSDDKDDNSSVPFYQTVTFLVVASVLPVVIVALCGIMCVCYKMRTNRNSPEEDDRPNNYSGKAAMDPYNGKPIIVTVDQHTEKPGLDYYYNEMQGRGHSSDI